MKFKNETDRDLTFPTLGLSVEAGETIEVESEEKIDALCNSVLTPESKSQTKRKAIQSKAEKNEDESEDEQED